MEFDICEILDEDEKSRICDDVLHALPNWFGVESSIVDYTQKVRTQPFYAALHNGRGVGFVAIQVHNAYTAEVLVMGIQPEYHRHGMGKQLIECCKVYCVANGHEFLTVKTLDASSGSKSYEKTRSFYQSMGFKPLQVFPLYWDAENPCLFLLLTITKP